MYVQQYVVPITTDAQGAGVGYTPAVNGRVLAISYVSPTTGGYGGAVEFEIKTEDSEVAIWDEDGVSASKAVYPRAATHTTAGAESDADVDYIPVAGERIKIAVANGGNGGTGAFYVMVG